MVFTLYKKHKYILTILTMQFVASAIIIAYLTGRSEFMLYVEVTEGS